MRNLEHETPLVVKQRTNAACSVQDLGTTAKVPPGFGNPEWSRDLEYVWRLRTAQELARLHLRSGVQRRAARRAATPTECVELWRSAEWNEHRARALAMPRGDLVSTCGRRFRKVRCGCGVIEVPVGCDVTQLCASCSKAHWRRWNRRISRAMDSHLRAKLAQWYRDRQGYRPGIYLVTFTMPHSGDIASDRKTMGEAWRALTKDAHAGAWWSTYALTWEVTPGTAGDGHVHMHLAAISSWIPYDELREAWQRHMPGAIQPDVSSPIDQKRKAKQLGRRYDPAESAAYYIAKYVTKGVNPREFTGQKAGELLVAFRGRRKVSTSEAFYVPLRDRQRVCKGCGELHRALGAPQGLASIAPGSQLNPRGWWDVGRRRHEQCVLQADTG